MRNPVKNAIFFTGFYFMKKLIVLILSLNFSAGASTLNQKQWEFSRLVAKLISHANEMGYEVALGEAWRSMEVAKFTPQQTKYNADHGIGILDSNHRNRVAIDLLLFKNGKFLTKTEDYKTLGEWWVKHSDPVHGIICAWGGNFKKLKDGNHFSLKLNGVE